MGGGRRWFLHRRGVGVGGLGDVGGRRGVLVEGDCGGGERELGFGGKEWIWRGESKHSKPKVCLIQN